MNFVVLSGRLAKDPVVVNDGSSTKTAVTRYTLAVPKDIKPDVGPDVDYITITALGKDAGFAAKWFEQGIKVMVTCHIHTGNYTNKDGRKVYTTDIVADSQEFGENKSSQQVAFKPAPFVDDLEKEQPIEPPEPKKKRGRKKTNAG